MEDMRIRNWKKFQHFKDRRPPWIKLHRDILEQRDIMMISERNFKILACLWLLASEDENMEGNLPPVQDIAFRLRYTEEEIIQSLQELSKFVEMDDINVISEQYQVGPPETETETETETEKKKNKQKKKVDAFVLPEGIDPDTWRQYEEMRKKINKPMTDRAKELAVSKLVEINQQTGGDPNHVLEQSILNSWQGLFAIKENKHAGNGATGGQGYRTKSNAERLEDQVSRLADKYAGKSYPIQ